MLTKNTKKVLVVGDVMIDKYISGDTNRISPEAPVPVLNVTEEFSVLGGAGNVANNLKGLNIDCALFGFIGKDENSKFLKRMLKSSKIQNHMFTSDVPTITKTRIVSQRQQIVRIDREVTFTDELLAKKMLNKIIHKYRNQVIIISDYLKGLCSDSFTKNLIKISKEYNIKVFIDPKGNDWSKYTGATLIKPNFQELKDVIGMDIKNDDESIVKYGRKILKKYKIDYMLVTRSYKGMTLIEKNNFYHIHSQAKEVYDVSGAGDTVISTLVFALINGNDIKNASKIANKAAGLVIGKFGTSRVNIKDLNI